MTINWNKPIRTVKGKVKGTVLKHGYISFAPAVWVQFNDHPELVFRYYEGDGAPADFTERKGPEIENYEPETEVTKATVDWTKALEVHDYDAVFPARLITSDRRDPLHNATYLLLYSDPKDGCEYTFVAREDGTGLNGRKFVKNAPTHVKGWINVFRGGGGKDRIASIIYADRDRAVSVGQKLSTYLTTVPVEWQE